MFSGKKRVKLNEYLETRRNEHISFMKPHQKHLICLAAMALMIPCGNAAENQKNPPPLRGFEEVGQAQVELRGGF